MNNILEKYVSNDLCEEVIFNNTYDGKNSEAQELLNSILELIPALKSPQLLALLNLIGEDSITKIKKKDASIVFFSKIFIIAAKSLGYQLYHKDNSFWIYNTKKWVKIDSQLFKEFLKTASKRMGISMFISSGVTFVNKLEKQVMQDAYFEISIDKESSFINVKNGIVSVNKKGVSFIEHNPQLFLKHIIDVEYKSSEVYYEFNLLDSIIPSKDTQTTLQQSIAQVFLNGFSNYKKICLYGLEEDQVSYFISSLKKVIPSNLIAEHFGRNDAKLDDMFVDFKMIKQEPTLLELPIVIPCSTDEGLSHLDNYQTLFNWLISGVKEIVKNKNLYISDECKEFKQRFNMVSLFVNETALVKTERNPKSIVTSYQDVFKQYELFCELNDEEALGRGKFNRELKALGFKSTRRESGNVWFAKFA